jgi:phage tail-like protein
VIDVNGTRFHLLLGHADWLRTRTAHGARALPPEDSPPSEAPRDLQWNAHRSDVSLWQETFRFPASKHQRVVPLDYRRGAARDRFGNWYWIAPDRQSILVWSTGSRTTSAFWPAPDSCAADAPSSDDGGFHATARTPAAPLTFQGLTITIDHYLVAGVTGDAGTAGLAVFDLYSGGAPRRRIWPVALEPFDLDAREGGGVWLLDRRYHRVWEVDRRFDVVVMASGEAAADDGWFTCADHSAPTRLRSVDAEAQAWAIGPIDAIGIAALPGAGGVLVVEREGGDGFARVHWLKDRAPRGGPVSTRSMLKHVSPAPGMAPFTLVAHDVALGARLEGDPDTWSGRLYVVGTDGNQTYAFGVDATKDHLRLDPRPEYFPMRLFGGRALAAAQGEPWYDSGDPWVRLVRQDRPRYAEEGELLSPVFDGLDPGCVWHRLMLDACIPSGAEVAVWSRASDDWRDLTLPEWLEPAERRALGLPDVTDPFDARTEFDLADWQPEPRPVPRRDGSELPYLNGPGAGYQTFELLFQRATGRYAQVKLVLRGDGRATPRLRALRAWYPRFSYLGRYLPMVYREEDATSRFLERFLANFEGLFTTIEDRIAAAQLLFDVGSAPPDTLEWLAQWVGVAIDPGWDADRRRLFIRHAPEFFAARGTKRGLAIALRLALDECVDDRLFTAGSAAARSAPVRIIERFRARRVPPALVGDAGTAVPGPATLDPTARWTPSLGGGELHRRFRAAFTQAPGVEFPLVAAGAPAGWDTFAAQTLGFVPRVGGAERRRWQTFLQGRYGSIAALNAAHAAAWPAFDAIALPSQQPAGAQVAADWRLFLETPVRDRQRWQAFLTRRYRTIGVLTAAWGRTWARFGDIAMVDRVPPDGAALADWFQFEGTVMAMHGTAHAFTVLLPVPRHQRTDTPAQRQRLARARTVLDLEKPAHTVYDTRFYWALFRLGQARLGDDTLIDEGSRAPELMGPMVLGEGYLAEAHLATQAGEDAPDRLLIGRDRVGRSTRVGGP